MFDMMSFIFFGGIYLYLIVIIAEFYLFIILINETNFCDNWSVLQAGCPSFHPTNSYRHLYT